MKNFCKFLFLTFLFICKSNMNFAMPEFDFINFAQTFFNQYKEYDSQNSSNLYPTNFISKDEFLTTIEQFKNTMNSFLDETMQTKLQQLDSQYHPFHEYVQKLEVSANTNIKAIGDIHSSAHSLIRNMLRWMAEKHLNNDFSANGPIIFTGDYISRGRYGAEVLYLIMKLKIKNPYSVFPIKGNHELPYLAQKFGFKNEISQKYGNDVFEKIIEIFNLLPSTLYLVCNTNTIKFCHGIIPFDNNKKPLIPETMINELRNFSTKLITFNKNLHLGEIYASRKEKVKNSSKARNEANLITIPIVKNLLDSSNLKTLIRGHDHAYYSVLASGKYPIFQQIPLATYPVYTLMSCPEGQGDICYSEGYITIVTSEYFFDWNLIPYNQILNPKRNEKYVHFYNNINQEYEFSWNENPQLHN
ncbi:hypothetical protein GF322_04940 [Candidatus Dependentiae bacterium]|nr:hypothetical protein [Candidatus Dependentiae bacterium]